MMKVQCVICDKIEEIERDSFQGKKLRNHPLATHMCSACQERIAIHTEQRRLEGKLPDLKLPVQDDEW